jgi:hypothetical protein
MSKDSSLSEMQRNEIDPPRFGHMLLEVYLCLRGSGCCQGCFGWVFSHVVSRVHWFRQLGETALTKYQEKWNILSTICTIYNSVLTRIISGYE